MEENKFFKWLWRINAIGLFLLLCAGLFSFVTEQLRHFQSVERISPPISTLAEDPKGVEKWVLGGSEKIAETPYIMLPLISEDRKVKVRDKGMYYSSRPYYIDTIAKNILFINSDKSQNSWLFKTNNQLILQHRILYTVQKSRNYYLSGNNKTSQAKLIYYKVFDRDTNGDKIVTTDDKENFAVSSISGKGYKIIVENIERIISVSYSKKNEMHLLYQKEGMGYFLRLNIESLEIISNVALPKVGV